MNDEFDISERQFMNRDQLVRARLQVRNEITLLRSEQNNGGPDRSQQIESQQEKLHAIASRLEPSVETPKAAQSQQPKRQGLGYGFRIAP